MRILQKELWMPVLNYLQFIGRMLFRQKRISPGLEKFLRTSIINFERLAIFIALVGYSMLYVFELWPLPFLNRLYITVPFFASLAVSIFFLFYARRMIQHLHLFSLYYILLFLITYHYPSVLELDGVMRSSEDIFHIHLFIVVVQVFRSGNFPGLPIILFMVIHLIFAVGFDEVKDYSSLNLLYFLFTSIVALFVERILYINTADYLELKLQEEREQDELKLAEKVHSNLFPTLRENEFMRIYSFRSPENRTGGDFFDLVQLREGNLGFFLADISGHGISSAMMSAALKVIISTSPYHSRVSPAQFLTRLDDIMCREYVSHHASAVYMFFDFHTKKVLIGNAGHPPILHSVKKGAFQELQTEGSLIGFNISRPIVKEVPVRLKKGDRFLIYTDGLTEFFDAEGGITTAPDLSEMIDGLERFEGDALLERILTRITSRKDFDSFRDDVMIVLLEVK